MSIPEPVYVFSKIVTALVIVLDPMALVPLVVGLQSRMSARQSRALVLKVVTGATVILLFFTATGTWVLRLFGVTLDDLRIAGGLLLLIISLKMIVEGRMGPSGEAGYDAAIAPLISPLLVGPGAITAAVVLAGIHGVAKTAAAAVVTMVICLVFLLSARTIYRVIGSSGSDIVTRLVSVLVAAIAVGYIRTGIVNVVAPR